MTGLTDLLDLVVCASNPRIGKVEAGGLGVQSRSWLYNNLLCP